MSVAALAAAIRAEGFAHVSSETMRGLLAGFGGSDDWAAFAAGWDDLGVDTFMADGGRYRKRRHAVFLADSGAPVARAPRQPHYQSRDYNPVNGGIERWFEPILPAVAETVSFRSILAAERALADALSPGVARWRIEAHQFRIEAAAGREGRPTPEGRHRDGVDHVLVMLVGRRNVREGVTTVTAPDGRALGSFTLAEPLESALVDDLRVFHGVTPIVLRDRGETGHRDVLVVTFRHEP